MKAKKLPPGQHYIDAILRWNIDHPGIVPENPKLDLECWTLTVDGEVEKPVKWTWQEFVALPPVEFISDFHCVEGWSVRDCRWEGVSFKSMAGLVKPSREARSVFFRCADGYTTSLAMDELLQNDVLLAHKLNDEYLDAPLGGPVRLVVPSKYAYKSAMWVERVTFAREKQLGFWEKRGYSDTADVWKNDRFAR